MNEGPKIDPTGALCTATALGITLASLLIPASATGQVMFGTARAVDGDTLALGETYVRLHGIDAVEALQACQRGGEVWNCGAEAESFLANLVQTGTVQCRQRDQDSYGRVVATCSVGGRDLSEQIVRAGYAVALTQFSDAYVTHEAEARARGVGIWASEFQSPADYRAANPQAMLPPPPRQVAEQPPRNRPRTARPSQPPQPDRYFRNCAEARAAGAAPLRRGGPGYRPQLDADGDGVACEPYRGN